MRTMVELGTARAARGESGEDAVGTPRAGDRWRESRGASALTSQTVRLISLALALVGCSHEESAAVVQARAAVTLAESDAHAARAAQSVAEAEAQRTHAAVDAADRDPSLVRARQAFNAADAQLAAVIEDRNRHGDRLDPTGHSLTLMRMDELGGARVRAENVVVRMQQPLRSAQAADQAAANRLGRARADANAKDALLARARRTLQATIAAAAN